MGRVTGSTTTMALRAGRLAGPGGREHGGGVHDAQVAVPLALVGTAAGLVPWTASFRALASAAPAGCPSGPLLRLPEPTLRVSGGLALVQAVGHAAGGPGGPSTSGRAGEPGPGNGGSGGNGGAGTFWTLHASPCKAERLGARARQARDSTRSNLPSICVSPAVREPPRKGTGRRKARPGPPAGGKGQPKKVRKEARKPAVPPAARHPAAPRGPSRTARPARAGKLERQVKSASSAEQLKWLKRREYRRQKEKARRASVDVGGLTPRHGGRSTPAGKPATRRSEEAERQAAEAAAAAMRRVAEARKAEALKQEQLLAKPAKPPLSEAKLNELAQKAQNRIDDWRKSGVVARRKAEEENREKRVKKTEEFKAALAQKERQRQEIYALNRLMKLEEDKAVEIYRRQVAERKRRDAAAGGGAPVDGPGDGAGEAAGEAAAAGMNHGV